MSWGLHSVAAERRYFRADRAAHIHSWHLGWFHPAAQVGIKHPLRNLQDWKSLEFIAHARQNGTAAPACLATNQHSLPMPGTPRVSDLSKLSLGERTPSEFASQSAATRELTAT